MNVRYVSSPANVEIAAFDALWGNELSPENDFFSDMAVQMKPLDLSLQADEDSWIFKMGIAAVRDIIVTTEPSTPSSTKREDAAFAPLTIDVHAHPHHHTTHEDEDATSVLMEPIMGSPVDELDAMTAFMVDDVDPFQAVVVTSDDEPMSPVPASSAKSSSRTSKSSSTSQYYTLAEEKKIDKLRATVTNLEKMLYARSHGRKSAGSASDVDIAHIKMVRSLERLQRITCDVAQENYGFRYGKMPQRVREELLLHELSSVLTGAATREQLCDAIADKLCSDAIVTTARSSAEAAMDLSSDDDSTADDQFCGWSCRLQNELATAECSFTAKKNFDDNADFECVTGKTWELLLSSERYAAFMQTGKTTTRSHVLKRLSDDVILVAFDSVKTAQDMDGQQPLRAVQVERDVCVAFRVRTTSGVMVAISSMAPSLFETTVQQVDSITFVEKGMRWMQFSSHTGGATTGFTVTAGGRVPLSHTGENATAAAVMVRLDALATLVQWERECIAPVFQFQL